MGIENCQIYFDNPSGAYLSGQTITGRVEFKFNSDKKVRGIYVSFKGEASTHWTQQEHYRNREGKSASRSVSFDGHEEYLHNKYYLLGGPNSQSTLLPAGEHTYTLTCVLPPSLPSSFEGDKGHVRYTVKVTLDRPWKFDQTLKAAFTVVSPLDLNINPRVREPATLTMEKHFHSCCCRAGSLTGVVKIPCTGFVPGQVVPFTIEIDNVSSNSVQDTKIKMTKIVTYHSQTPQRSTKKEEVTLVSFNLGSPVGPMTSKNFSHNFTVPSLPPSNLTNCGIIDIDYAIKIKVIVAGLHRDMHGTVPVLVGTIPLTNMVQMQIPAVPSTSMNVENGYPGGAPTLGWIPGPANAPIDPYLMPPPSYEECQFGTKSIMDSSDSEYTKFNSEKPFAPMYPVYHFNMVPTASVGDAGPSAPPKQ